MNSYKSGRLHSCCWKRKCTVLVSFSVLRTHVCVLAATFVVRSRESRGRKVAHIHLSSVLSLFITVSLCSRNQCSTLLLKLIQALHFGLSMEATIGVPVNFVSFCACVSVFFSLLSVTDARTRAHTHTRFPAPPPLRSAHVRTHVSVSVCVCVYMYAYI